jgi:molybdate transport system regulatory protein
MIKKKKEFRVRCWIDVNGTKFFGPGRLELLEKISESGSIAKAAKSMGMSYKKAWAMIEDLNSSGSQPYVITHKGGKKGGGTEVTPAAKKLMYSYQQLISKLNQIVDKETEILKLV